MRFARTYVLAFLSVLVFFAPSAFAQNTQVTPDLEEGMKAFGDFYGGDIDQVSLSSGKLVLDIHSICYPQRGSKIKLCFSIRYQNITPRQTEKYYPNTDTYVEHLFRDAVSANDQGGGLKFVDNLGGWVAVGPGVNWSEVWSPDNNLHNMLYVSSTGNFESNDATGLSFNTPADTLITPDGVRHIYSYSSTTGNTLSKVEDPNGNFVTPTTNSSGAITAWTDTLGRSIATPLGATSTTDYSHCTGANPIGAASIWTVPGPNGGTETFKFCYATYSYSFQSDIGGQIATAQGNLSMLQSIVLPNFATWTFHYEPTYAALDQITLPTGGTIGYTWGLNYAPCQYSSTTDPRTQVVTTKWGWWLAVASRTVNANDGTGAKTWTYSGGTITDPLGNQSVHVITGLAGTGSLYETQAKYYQGSSSTGTLLKTVNTDYSWQFYPLGGVQTSCQNVISVVPIRVTTIWPNGQTTKVETDYDSGFTGTPTSGGGTSETAVYGQVVAKREYAYRNGSPGPLLRQTKTSYIWQSNSTYLAYNFLAYPSSVQVLDGSGVQRAYTAYSYDQFALASSGISTQHDSAPPDGAYRGNRTSTARWLNGSVSSTAKCPISVSNGYLYTYSIFFDTGTVQKATDSCGTSAGDPNHTTTYAYSSNYAGAWPTTITNPVGQSVSQTFDFNTAVLTSRIDPNNQTTTYKYNDSLGRLTEVDYPDQGMTKNFYTDTPLAVAVETQRQIDSTRRTDSFVLYNGLAHPVVRSAANDEGTPYDRADTCYDALGRVSFTSYPYQSSSATSVPNCSGVGDSFAYDGLGRTTQVTHSDGSSVLTSYTGRATQVQDEGNGTRRVTRISQVDGLGQLAGVCEVTSASQHGSSGSPAACGLDISATGFLTIYGDDTLGNLTSVSQSGLNGRSFQYDSLSRLTSASNPESGTTSFGYDANSNVISKTDARSITTISTYDFLNRLTGKTYSDSTAAATVNYDQTSALGVSLTNTIGRKSSESTGGSSPTGSVFSYDSMGRVTDNSQCTPQNCGTGIFAFQYPQYDFLGNLISGTNAAGVTFTYSYNRAARLTSITTNFIDPSHPGTLFSNAHYAAFGGLTSSTLGNSLNESLAYDNRLRLESYAAASGSTTKFSFNITNFAPNGDVLAANDSVNGNWTYSYDDFNRISGSNQNSGQAVYSYVYDRFGNRWQQNGPNSMQLSFSGANNRMDGYSYDAAGNLLNDGSHSYFYDAEDRLIQVGGTLGNCSTATSCYVYDAEGRRVRKATASGILDFLYDAQGHKVGEVDTTGTFQRGELYASGRHFAVYAPDPGPTGATFFIHADWLGTERARTDMSGTACETIKGLPFGDGQTISDTCGDSAGDVSPLHFTGKPRDTESNLDYFGARYYSSQLGRFTTPDWAAKPTAVPYAMFGDPQTLNLYGYVRNNPILKADVDGHCEPFCDIMVKTITAAAAFSARHPEVGKAYDKVVSSLSLKISGGVAVKTPETSLPVSGGASLMGYVKVSSEGAVSVGANASVSAAVLGSGKKVEGDLSVVKDGKLVNPLENAKVETSSTASGGKDGVDVEGSGNESGEGSLAATYGEGPAAGVDLGADVGELGEAIFNGIISDIGNEIDQLKQGISLFSTGSHDRGDNTKPVLPRPQ